MNMQVFFFDPIDLNGKLRLGVELPINVQIRVRVRGFLMY